MSDLATSGMSAVDAFVSGVWQFLATGLVHGTVLALVTFALAAVFLRRARPALLVALWTIVLVKFAIPFGPEVPVSLSGLIDAAVAPDAAAPVAVVHGVHAAAAPTPAAPTAGQWAWLAAQLALLLAYVGVVGWLLARRIRALRAHARVAAALPPVDASLAAAIAAVARTLDLPRAPAARLDPHAASPYIAGLLRPIVVIPAHLRGPALEAALLHELAHLRRRDTWLRVVQLVVGAVFFFWPPVAYVNRRIDDGREMACDHWAITRGSISAVDYARMLVKLARRRPAPAAASARLLGGKKQLRTRVDSLLAGPAKPRLGAVTGALVASWALISLGGAQAHASLPGGAPMCVVSPGIAEQILISFPDADVNGDGALSKDEVCAHQERMRQMLADGVIDSAEASLIDPIADADGDGILTGAEVEVMNQRVWAEVEAEMAECRSCTCETAPSAQDAHRPDMGRICTVEE